MSNPLFENPKVALGFAGVVVAIAVVAGVALQEFSPAANAEQRAAAPAPQAQAAQTSPQAAPGGFASNASTGWAGDAGTSDDWGAPGAASQGGGFAQPSEMTNDAPPVFGDHRSKTVSGGGFDRSSGPKISSSAAPGAPPVRPPETGFTPEIKVKGN